LERKLNIAIHAIRELKEQIMALSDDLKAVLADLTTEVNRIGGEIDQLLTVIGTPGISAADAATAIDQAKALVAQLKAASDKSDAQVP
jgi:hypothetical protein